MKTAILQSRPHLYLILGFFKAVHSVEEVATHLYEGFQIVTEAIHLKVGFFPVLEMSRDVFAAANIVIVALILGLSPFVFLNNPSAIKIARFIAVIEVLNGLVHISGAAAAGGYYPGAVSAAGLLAAGILFLAGGQKLKGQS
jgi:hypothetical protein